MEVTQNCDPQDSTTNLHFEHIQQQQVKLDCGFFDSAFQILLPINSNPDEFGPHNRTSKGKTMQW